MSRRRSNYSSYSSYYNRRENQRRIPSPLPYLVVALLAGAGLAYFHVFAYQSVQGKISNAYSGAVMPGVPVAVSSAQGTATPGSTPQVSPSLVLTATTGPDGGFAFDKLPQNPILSVAVDGFTPQQIDVAGKRDVDIKLVPNVLTGKVMGADGKPIASASVWAGDARTQTAADGGYVLKNIPAERKLVVKAPGYLSNSVQFGNVVTQDITLQPFIAKAIYLNADTIATPGKLQSLLKSVAYRQN